MTILRGRGCLATKININFFERNEVLNIFDTTIFFKKETIPSEIIVKNNFGGNMTIFQEVVCPATKMNITFSMGNGVPNTELKHFPRKTVYWLNESQKTSFGGHIFSHVSGSTGLIVSKTNRVHPCVDSHQPCEFHENRFKTATCIVTVIIIISRKPRSVIF